jgi:hypothetical protein
MDFSSTRRQAAHCCRIRFLPISVWRFTSFNEPNLNAQKECLLPAHAPLVVVRAEQAPSSPTLKNHENIGNSFCLSPGSPLNKPGLLRIGRSMPLHSSLLRRLTMPVPSAHCSVTGLV